MESSHNSYDYWKDYDIKTSGNYNHVYSDDNVEHRVELATINWSLNFNAINEDNEYSVSLVALNKSPLWKCDVELEAKFTHRSSDRKFVKTIKKCSSSQKELEVETTFENGAKSVSVDVSIKLKNIEGVRYLQRSDIYKKVPELRDVFLVFDEKKLKVNKAYLAHFSPFFKNLFFGNYLEKNQQEIPIKDVDFEEFADLMNVISPERKKITKDNVGYILKLANQFDMQEVITYCEEYFKDYRHDDAEKLMLADKYGLNRVLDDFLGSPPSKDTLKEIRESEMYQELSHATKSALFEEAYQLLMKDESK